MLSKYLDKISDNNFYNCNFLNDYNNQIDHLLYLIFTSLFKNKNLITKNNYIKNSRQFQNKMKKV